ncbi:MAG: hypothetical protein EOO25_20235, partial [Comamonadaceae bacterium]
MIWWGIIWGGVLGVLWPGREWELQGFLGAVLGAIAGRMLRNAIRKEIQAAQVPPVVAAAAAPVTAVAPPQDSQPLPAAMPDTP